MDVFYTKGILVYSTISHLTVGLTVHQVLCWILGKMIKQGPIYPKELSVDYIKISRHFIAYSALA